MKPVRLAAIFDEKARPFFSTLGFELENDPNQAYGPYGTTYARYRSPAAFFLSVCFEPSDGHCATLTCGRKWMYATGLSQPKESCRLSNLYCVLAQQFELDVPAIYEFGSTDEALVVMERIIEDLHRTLPVVFERVTLADLEAIERSMAGPLWNTDRSDERSGSRPISVTEYPETE